MVNGALGSWYGITEVLVKSVPLMLTGLGVGIFDIYYFIRFDRLKAEEGVFSEIAEGGVILERER